VSGNVINSFRLDMAYIVKVQSRASVRQLPPLQCRGRILTTHLFALYCKLHFGIWPRPTRTKVKTAAQLNYTEWMDTINPFLFCIKVENGHFAYCILIYRPPIGGLQYQRTFRIVVYNSVADLLYIIYWSSFFLQFHGFFFYCTLCFVHWCVCLCVWAFAWFK